MADGAPSAGEAAIEITLTDLAGRPADDHHDGDGDDISGARPPNWRRIVGLASLAGVVLGLLAAALILNRPDDDPPDDAPTTGPDGSLTISDITTPPTLTPLADLPPPEFTTRGTLSTAPQPTTSQDRDLYQPPPSTLYPRATDVPTDGQFDLEAAVASLADDLPRRARTHLELGESGYVLDTTIVRDPTNDRYEVTLAVVDDEQRFVVDVAGGVTYLHVDDGWFTIPNDELLASTGTTDPREFFDRLLLGPLRPDTIDAASSDPGSFVSLGEMVARDAVVAREYTVVLPGAVVPEWQLYVFSPIAEFSPDDRPEQLTYTVYVTQSGELGNVIGTSLVGDVVQRLSHSIEPLDPPITIRLPDPDTIVERPDGSR
jgi:hypothetical protein